MKKIRRYRRVAVLTAQSGVKAGLHPVDPTLDFLQNCVRLRSTSRRERASHLLQRPLHATALTALRKSSPFLKLGFPRLHYVLRLGPMNAPDS